MALATPEANALLASIAEEKRPLAWWFVQRDGIPLAGDAGGVVALMSELPGMRRLGYCLKSLKLSPAVDALDKLVAHYRGQLSRIVPDVTVIRRYP